NKETITAYGVRCDDYFGLKGVAHRAACVVDRHGRIAWFWMDEDSSKLPDFEALKEAVRKASAL
ncbi:MAG: peroxiredoxin, partial [Gemmatimonadota bacterium]